MKKYNFYLWLTVLVGLLASCSKDGDADALQNSESNRVSLTASLPADFAQPETRAVPPAPAGHKLRCILEIWDDALNTLKVRQEICATGTESFQFSFELQDIGNYKALLWADYIADGAASSPVTIAGLGGVGHFPDKYYETNTDGGLKAVSLIESEYTNTAARDAFFVCKPFEKKATALNDLSARLTRPFTLLTIAEKNATNFGYCKKVKASYSVPKTINVSDGTLSGTYAATYDAAPEGRDISVNTVTCKTLFSDYIFADDDGTMDSGITLEFTPTPASGKVLNKVTIPAGTPAKRNYQINAAGNLITATDAPSTSVQMTVDISSSFTGSKDADIIAVPEPAVGDYYYSDGTWSTDLNASKTVLGVVFKVGPGTGETAEAYGGNLATNKIRGYVVALNNDTDAPYCTATNESFGLSTSETNYTGYTGTQKLQSRADYSQTTFPALYTILNRIPKSGDGVKNSGWYMPSVAQLVDVYTNRSILDTKLTVVNGGKTISNDYGFHVTTTEVNATQVMTVWWDGDRGPTKDKSNKGELKLGGGGLTEHQVRAILTF